MCAESIKETTPPTFSPGPLPHYLQKVIQHYLVSHLSQKHRGINPYVHHTSTMRLNVLSEGQSQCIFFKDTKCHDRDSSPHSVNTRTWVRCTGTAQPRHDNDSYINRARLICHSHHRFGEAIYYIPIREKKVDGFTEIGLTFKWLSSKLGLELPPSTCAGHSLPNIMVFQHDICTAPRLPMHYTGHFYGGPDRK